jgi:hypothetical protein
MIVQYLSVGKGRISSASIAASADVRCWRFSQEPMSVDHVGSAWHSRCGEYTTGIGWYLV